MRYTRHEQNATHLFHVSLLYAFVVQVGSVYVGHGIVAEKRMRDVIRKDKWSETGVLQNNKSGNTN